MAVFLFIVGRLLLQCEDQPHVCTGIHIYVYITHTHNFRLVIKHVTTNSNYYGAQNTEYNILGLCHNEKST